MRYFLGLRLEQPVRVVELVLNYLELVVKIEQFLFMLGLFNVIFLLKSGNILL